jgi:hypothetical protein
MALLRRFEVSLSLSLAFRFNPLLNKTTLANRHKYRGLVLKMRLIFVFSVVQLFQRCSAYFGCGTGGWCSIEV